MQHCKYILPFFLCAVIGQADVSYGATITEEQWSRPRTGAMIISLRELSGLINRLDRFPNRHLVLRYRTGDDGILSVEELRAWLIALGIPSDRIVLIPGLHQTGVVDIRISSGSKLQ
jgi:hypothetical protein